jgi:SAM-dependent methyltransferase
MARWEPASYGDRFASVYDDWYPPDGPETALATDVLASLAGAGPVLELGAGTGRLAVPLATRGLEVWALDASAAMLDRLSARPGGDRVRTVCADMADFSVDRRFALVVCVANTLFNVADAAGQARCLALAARHLAPGGRVVIEAFVPDPDVIGARNEVTVRTIEPDRVTLAATRTDPDRQLIETAVVVLGGGAAEVYPARLRWAGPDEIDAMATAAGLTLAERWSDWSRAPFSGDSTHHVSVYRAVTPPSGQRGLASRTVSEGSRGGER